jgi:hypothetical protein
MPRRENDHVTWTLPSGANSFQRYKHDIELPLVADHDAVAAAETEGKTGQLFMFVWQGTRRLPCRNQGIYR